MDAVVHVDQLCHRYGERLAVDHLSFDARPGEVLGLLGPNGAGKTTTVRVLNGLLSPASGDVRVMGLDPAADGSRLRSQTGVLTETPALYERLTARQNLIFFGTLAGLDAPVLQQRIDDLLAFFELSDRIDQRITTYSKGMKQRLALVRALLHRPQVLFLDEPTSGLDPEAAQMVHELVESICQENGQTVLLCTHNLHEAERLCDRLVILDRGRLLAFGSLEELRRQLLPGLWVEVHLLQPLPPSSISQIAALPGVVQATAQDEKQCLVHVKGEEVVPSLAALLVSLQAQLLSLMPRQVSLQEIYFQVQRQNQIENDEVQHEC